MDFIIKFVKGLVETNAARLIAYSGTAATAAALYIAGLLGLHPSNEFIIGVAAFATVVMTELIRQLVYSQANVEAAVEEKVEEVIHAEGAA